MRCLWFDNSWMKWNWNWANMGQPSTSVGHLLINPNLSWWYKQACQMAYWCMILRCMTWRCMVWFVALMHEIVIWYLDIMMSFYFYFSEFLHEILHQTVFYGWKIMHNFNEKAGREYPLLVRKAGNWCKNLK